MEFQHYRGTGWRDFGITLLLFSGAAAAFYGGWLFFEAALGATAARLLEALTRYGVFG